MAERNMCVLSRVNSAVNMALPAFAAERHGHAVRCCWAPPLSIDLCPHSVQQ